MAVEFYYPTQASPQKIATLPDPQAPYVGDAPEFYNTSFITDGGTRYVYNKGVKENFYVMNFAITDPAIFQGIIDLFENYTLASQKTFEFIDPRGNLKSGARFTHTSIRDRIREIKLNKLWTLSLEIVV